ncbi:MAG: DUF4091 domain-containing protein [Kiritimatiellae bacterium]|nr:DUF4091 domain-containing protein [Kiritimatiellia bacterium]
MNTIALLFGAALNAAFNVWWVDPYGDPVYLPSAAPQGGVITNELSCAAARGEIETISFSVEPSRDMKKVDFVPSELKGPGGATIPASAADFALVKVWYRAGGRWSTSWCGNCGDPELVNDLVIHDNDLVRVVESAKREERTVKVRIDYPEGPAYVDFRKHGNAGSRFNWGLHPVVDPKKFVPFDLQKGRFQQYWFTWRIPEETKPGVYRGSLAVKEDGKDLASIPVQVEVYPFMLPRARTHYDPTKRFISAWMGTPSLAGELALSKNMADAERRVRGVYRSLAEHNCHEPSGPGEFSKNDPDDLAVRSLIMMRQEGMDCELLINGWAFDGQWQGAYEGGTFVPPEEDAARFEEAKARFSRKLDVQRDVLEKYLGHHTCHFSSADECGTYFNRQSYPFWGLIHKYGMHTWTDYGVAKDISWSVDMNDVPACTRHRVAWQWHGGDAKAVTYAGPFTGPLCPDIWRRTKGIRYYYADFDGHHEYCFYHGECPWNDFSARSSYSQFVIVYPTFDGLIPSLAWEGVREGLDDIRYLSLLKLRCLAAIAAKDPKIQALGRKHLTWMETREPESIIDLFAFRREVARRAIELIEVVGPEPDDRPKMPPPALPPCTYGKTIPPGADLFKVAEQYAAANRYDLAIPLLDKIRKDASRKPAERFEAATKQAALLSGTLKRDQAIKVIEETLPQQDLKNAQRAKLHLQRVKVMMTPRIFEEEFTVPQLDKAAEAIVDALKRPGATGDERFAPVNQMLRSYLSGGLYQRVIDFADKRFEDMKLSPHAKSQLYLRKASAYAAMKNYELAARMYRIVYKTCECPACINRDFYKGEGWVAEQLEDWKTAEKAYSLEAKTYNDEEGDKKSWCVGRLRRVMAKLQASEKKKDISFDDTDDGSAITLDD